MILTRSVAKSPSARRTFIGILSLMLICALSLPAVVGAQDQWARRGLDGVRVNALAVDPQAPEVIYAGSNGGGVFRTTNAGQAWPAVNSGLGNLFVNTLAIDPANRNIVLAGTGRGPAVGEPNAGIYRTTNRGDNWTAAITDASIHGLARSPANPQTIFAAGAGIWRSTDGGLNWTRLAQGDAALANIDLRGIAVSPADANLLVAIGNTEGGTGLIVRSTNGGVSWSLALGGLAPVFAVAFAPSGPSVVLVGGQSGIFRSTDGGANFQLVTQGLNGASVLEVSFNPANPQEVFAGSVNQGVFRSTDTGATWNAFDGNIGGQTVRALAMGQPSPQTIYAGTDTGIFAITPAAPPPPPPPATSTWYFAEGSTQQPFDTWFLVQNPTSQTAQVRFTFQVQGGGEIVRTFNVGPTSRFSLFANEVIPNTAFSTRIDANQAIFAERSMFVGYDGHVVTGIPGPNTTWLFAEGSTQSPFHTWLLLQNPHAQEATATITYLRQQGTPTTQTLRLPPTSRASVFVNDVLPNAAFSTRVQSDRTIVAERAMYRFPGNAATGVSGVNAPDRSWYFAHGDTQAAAHTWLLLQNPHTTPVTAQIALLEETGRRTDLTVTLPPTSRQSLFLNQTLGSHRFGIIVNAGEPIVAEKSLFFGTEPRGAAATQGATDLATVWNLPEGSTAPPFEEFITILNPHAETMTVHIDFQLPNGQVIGRHFTIDPARNLIVRVDDIIPSSAVSARVTTSRPSVVERTMFFDKLGSRGGHNTIGIRQP